MEIIRTILFLFVINNSTPVTTQAELQKAFIGSWRVVEIVAGRKNGKEGIRHPALVYHFLADGTANVRFRTHTEKFAWKLDGMNLRIYKPGKKGMTSVTPHFVHSTRDAWKIIETKKTEHGRVIIMFIKAMPDIDK